MTRASARAFIKAVTRRETAIARARRWASSAARCSDSDQRSVRRERRLLTRGQASVHPSGRARRRPFGCVDETENGKIVDVGWGPLIR